MVLSHSEENKNKIISLAISLGIFVLLILFFIFYVIVTPNPPFPVTEGGGGGMEFNIGNMIEGSGNIDPNNGIGDAPKVVESTESTQPTPQNNSEDFVTSENGEDADIKKNEVKNTQPVVVIPVKEKTMAEKIREAAIKNQGKNGGGDGESNQAGNEGRPDGKPNTDGKGGTGGGPDDGDGTKPGPGKGDGKGNYGFSLAGRKMTTPPPVSKDTQEEGTVVVEITVDRNGNVIKADAVGRGTNTNNIMLKTKARQAALATKFNVSGEFEEQKGTITIIFKF